MTNGPTLAEVSGGESAHADRLAARRRTRSLDAFAEAIESDAELDIPGPVTEIVMRPGQKLKPTLTPEAFELARQVYYLQHGSLTDAARAVIDAGLADVDDVGKISDRLRGWWKRESWPKRSQSQAFALRDANFDGGLIRGSRTCRGVTTGKGVAPAGEPCGQSALADSDFCFQHDLRPEYVKAREEHAQLLLAYRLADSVPLQPFVDWCTATRAELVAEARSKGRAVHANESGWTNLADHLKVDKIKLHKLASKGVDSNGKTPRMVRASTVVRYLEARDDVSFEDIYGFAPPLRRARTDATKRCPECGGSKDSASKVCRNCFDTRGVQCAHVTRRGDRCPATTRDASGYCYHCRRARARVPRPRTGRRTYLTDAMLTLATGAYVETPTFAEIGRRMWAVNAEGVCDIFSSCQSLTGSLVKQFAKRGWSTPEAIAAAHDELVGQLGAAYSETTLADLYLKRGDER